MEWVDAIQGLSDVILTIVPEDVPHVMRTAKEHPDLAFDFLRSLHGVDQQPDGFDVVYLLYSYRHHHAVEIKTRVPLDDPRVASVTSVWKGANWHERETRDLYGVVFDGHPDLRPLLMPEDLIDVHPHRKDYPLAEIEIVQGEGVSQEDGGDAE
jgi:NADH-quinone oxidoreductase subunit C